MRPGDTFNPYKRLSGAMTPLGVVRHHALDSHAKLLYGLLRWYSHGHAETYVGNATLKRDLNVSASTVARALESLDSAGFIRRERREHPKDGRLVRYIVFVWHDALADDLTEQGRKELGVAVTGEQSPTAGGKGPVTGGQGHVTSEPRSRIREVQKKQQRVCAGKQQQTDDWEPLDGVDPSQLPSSKPDGQTRFLEEYRRLTGQHPHRAPSWRALDRLARMGESELVRTLDNLRLAWETRHDDATAARVVRAPGLLVDDPDVAAWTVETRAEKRRERPTVDPRAPKPNGPGWQRFLGELERRRRDDAGLDDDCGWSAGGVGGADGPPERRHAVERGDGVPGPGGPPDRDVGEGHVSPRPGQEADTTATEGPSESRVRGPGGSYAGSEPVGVQRPSDG